MWLYNNKQFIEEDIGDYFGFVYLIENNLNGRKYVGKKFFTRAGTKQIKGKKKKVRLSSGWSAYWSSSKELQEDVKKLGEENFTRTILYLCKSRSECTYLELKEQIDRCVLESDAYYNAWISAKITKKNLKFCP